MKKVLILIMFVLIVVSSVSIINNGSVAESNAEKNITIIDKEIGKEIDMEEKTVESIMEGDDIEAVLTEWDWEMIDDFRERTSYRFGGRVRENFIEREVELKEEDFEKLRKGQYLNQKIADEERSKYVGIVEILGIYDGDMVRSLPTANRKEPPLGNIYYKIEENIYAVLFFRNQRSESAPLESVEIWKEIWHEDGTYDLERRELKIK